MVLLEIYNNLLDSRLGDFLESVLARFISTLQEVGFLENLDLSACVCLSTAEVSGNSCHVFLTLEKQFEYL